MVVIKPPRPTSASVVKLARKNPGNNRPLTAGTFKNTGVSNFVLIYVYIYSSLCIFFLTLINL